jgi:nicotinate dehydrogenase subunit B
LPATRSRRPPSPACRRRAGRAALLALAAARLDVPVEALATRNGAVVHGAQAIGYDALLRGERIRLPLDPGHRVKDAGTYALVGKSSPRVDIPAKATGSLTFVHDMRVEGMLHGRVVRPPYAGLDAGEFVGNSLIGVDHASVAHLPGLVSIVTRGDFVGIVAEREEIAELAMHLLKVEWKACRPCPGSTIWPWTIWPERSGLARRARATFMNTAMSMPRLPGRRPRSTAVMSGPITCTPRSGHRAPWPTGTMGRSGCGAARRTPSDARRSGPAAGYCPRAGRCRADGSGGLLWPQLRRRRDRRCRAAVASRRRPVRVQLTREQEHQWEPKGAGQLMQVRGALDAQGGALAYDYTSRYPSNGSPTLALLLTGIVSNQAEIWEMGDRTSVAPLPQQARGDPRYPADRARLVAARRLGLAQQLCP